ncbi:TIGR02996 domain-containing protein [Gemmata sp. JC717]|uniref:TIGR02996 domain-containing protein n=1 Tax=Gemmata algarum TaxID=2975278 RepID=UPI0021BA94E2|nr:TIGR02996 domain-containing protein [Gemmata algarum]MDY3556733.1 TIGR02996 domain-containing protein [Gemmata algarum]
MSDRTAFIDAILNNPNDDTARLVFADWLEEHGEPERAEFIRVQIEPAKASDAVRERNDPGARTSGAHGAAMGGGWRKAIGISETEGEYVRGFLTGVEVHSTDVLRLTGYALAFEPIEFVLQLRARHLDGTAVSHSEVETLAASPHLRAVKTLTAGNKYNQERNFGPDRFALLMKSPYLINLRLVAVIETGLGSAAVAAIVESSAQFALESLNLSQSLTFSPIAQTAIEQIASSHRFTSLKRLSLQFNYLDSKAADALLASRTLPSAMTVDAHGNNFTRRQISALAKRFAGDSDEERT